jgi:transposase-like protein
MTFKNLQQLFDTFNDEETCRHYLEQQRWNGNVECPFCGCTKVYRTNRGFKCADKFCAKKFSVTVGTIYENSKVGLRTFFAALYLISSSKKGISSLQLSRQLGITQKSAWFVLHRIREMLKDKTPHAPYEGIVEIDETYVGGKNSNKHKSKQKKLAGVEGKIPVMGVLDREKGVRTYVLPNTNLVTMQGVVKYNMGLNAEVITDAHPSYLGLKKLGYKHTIVKKDVGSYITDSHFHTNNMEGFWSIMKRGIYGIYHQVSEKHLQRYCDEFSARYNTRDIKDNERFEKAVKNSNGRLKYNDLILKH